MSWKNDQWSRERGPAQLSHRQFEAGEPCPGCGRPYLRKTSSGLPEDLDWLRAHRAQHPEIHAHAHAVDNGPLHCGLCCPPPPLTPSQVARIAAILRA